MFVHKLTNGMFCIFNIAKYRIIFLKNFMNEWMKIWHNISIDVIFRHKLWMDFYIKILWYGFIYYKTIWISPKLPKINHIKVCYRRKSKKSLWLFSILIFLRFWVFSYIIYEHSCLKCCSFTKLLQIVFLINVQMFIWLYARCSYKLRKLLWFNWFLGNFYVWNFIKLSQIELHSVAKVNLCYHI